MTIYRVDFVLGEIILSSKEVTAPTPEAAAMIAAGERDVSPGISDDSWLRVTDTVTGQPFDFRTRDE
jgi:hypothetical protein